MGTETTRRKFPLVESVEALTDEGYVVLTGEQAEEICDVLIQMATRLPLKRRNHEGALSALGWMRRRRP